MHLSHDQPIDDSVLQSTVSVADLPRATALTDALRTLVVEHLSGRRDEHHRSFLRKLITSALLSVSTENSPVPTTSW